MDSTPKIVSCVQNAATRANLLPPATEAIQNIIGLSLEIALHRLFKNDDPAFIEQIISLYRDEYLYSNTTPSPLFSGSRLLLNTLKAEQRLLAVATGKMRRGLDRIWQDTDTAHYFHTSCCADEAESKPHPDMLLKILSQLNIEVNEAVMIGDTEHDMGMAQSINMPRIGVTYGAQPKEKLLKHQPLVIVDSVNDLHQWL